MVPPASPANAAAPTDYEAVLPEGQRWLNRFCENWIFAFLVAMAIRHFVLEAFRIPTASMEPMLYGDPGFLKGDHVVVDKLLFRFRSPKRWDVTVFQFPEPEIEAGDGARPAIDADGHPLNQWPFRPLMYRNFVKRLVAMPGDVFYIANGDFYLKDPSSGTFTIARKPPAVQEALWQEIYQAGAQVGYLPWQANQAGSTVNAHENAIDFSVTPGGEIDFAQPFRNLYLKPGPAGVKKMPDGTTTTVDVSMIAPQFTYEHGEIGNIWDMDQWQIYRLTTDDLDNNRYGTNLNAYQSEWVGDVRVQGMVSHLRGHPALVLRHGHQQGVKLTIGDDGWRVDGIDGLARAQPLAHGTQVVQGHHLSLAHLDGQCIVSIDHSEVARFDVPAVDPNVQRTQFAITGDGEIELTGLHLQRDIHYTRNWVLKDVNEPNLFDPEKLGEKARLELNLQQAATDLERDKAASQLNDIARVRHQFGCPDETSAWGYSPETAVTVPHDCYLMLGDNSPTSWDGRAWGFVPAINLRGRALAVVLPFTRWRLVR